MNVILVIEDDTDIRKNIQQILELFGFDVIAAKNGLDGLYMAKKHLPSLIICDVLMPELDGFRVLEELKQNSNTKFIPLIFLTAKVDDWVIIQGLKLGATDYLTKPFSIDRLFETVNNILKQAMAS